MKRINITVMTALGLTALITILWASFSLKNANAQQETQKPKTERTPASRSHDDFDRPRDRDRRPPEGFGQRRGPGRREGEEGFDRGMGPERERGPRDDKGFGPGRGSGRDKGRGSPLEFMTPTETEELMAFAKEHFPKIYEKLKYAQQSDQRAFRHMLKRVGGHLYRLYRLHRHDPELAKILIAEHKVQMEIFELQRDYRQAQSTAERESIKTALREQLTKRFEFRQQHSKLEIEALRKRIEEQAKRLEESEQNKDKIIDQELNDIAKRLEGKSF